MTFPSTPRVIYDRNPLVEVICQLRFQPILRIETELPAAFQDSIRNQYPEYEEHGGDVSAPTELPDVMRRFVQQAAEALRAGRGQVEHQFSSDDGKWKVSLARDFVALTSLSYERWEHFRGRLVKLIEALVGAYGPPTFTRVGLRYRDVVTRSKLGLEDVPWRELLNSHIAGELAMDAIDEKSVAMARRQLRFRLDQGPIHVYLQHGIVEVEARESPNEDSYLVDADFYAEGRADAEQAFDHLDRAHSEAGSFWRWCITDRLHDALGPNPTA
jgi:uncharacterized protein (TIGR04255 family)